MSSSEYMDSARDNGSGVSGGGPLPYSNGSPWQLS